MFDFQQATDAGYSQDEIMDFLSKKNPSFDFQKATDAGYSPEEITQFLSQPEKEKKEERGIVEKGARIAGQYALGLAEAANLPYDLAVASLASKEAQTVAYRQFVMEDIERLVMQKQTGVWDEKDQELLESLEGQIRDVKKAEEFVQTADISVRGLAEKITGIDLKPEGFAENLANMAGFIKDPKKLANIAKLGLKPKTIARAVLPTGKELIRGIGIETGLKIAEDGGYGPIGKIGAMIIGDIAGGGFGKSLEIGKEAFKDPKKFLAKTAAKFTPKEKQALQQDIIRSFRENGIQPDLGTITDSNLIKMTQARLSQSGLVGKKLDAFKDQIFGDIRESYQKLASELGEARFATNYEAGAIGRESIKSIQKNDLAEVRKIYQNAEDMLVKPGGMQPFVEVPGVIETTKKLKRKLSFGKLKSEQQKKVLDIVNTVEGDLKYGRSNVKDLIANKIALNDMINYEIQGGTKQLLKELVGDLDRAVISYGKKDSRFAKEYIRANKRFSQHAKTFRNKDISRLLREEDPAKLMNRMNSVDGIKKLDNILKKTKEGQEIFAQLKRKKLEDLFMNSFISNSEKQLKMGTFENALSKGKNAEIAKEILGKKSFDKLQKIQKNAGILNESAQKFYNASKSGIVAADVAIGVKYLNDIFHLLSGNPWPFIKTTGGLAGAKGLSSLMSDPHFIKLVEDVIMKGAQKNEKNLFDSIKKLTPYFKLLEEETQSDDPNVSLSESISSS